MSPREYFQLSEEMRHQISQKEERAATLRRLATSLAPRLARDVRVQSSPGPDRMQTLMEEAMDEELAAAALRDSHAEMLLQITLAISSLPDPRMTRLLELRYLEGSPWSAVVAAMHQSRSVVLHLHRLSLDLLPEFPEPVIPQL